MQAITINISNLSIEDLQELKEDVDQAISLKIKEECLSKSGWIEDVLSRRGEHANYIIDHYDFVEVLDISDVLFIKWFLNEKLERRKDYPIPKFIHKCTRKDVPETTYIFDDNKKGSDISAGKKNAIVIHEDSLPYLKEEFEEWAFEM